jgi:hypothetical protein
MLDKPLTPNENRRRFDAVLVRALTDGQRCSSCSGLHRDVLDAIDAVAEAWLNELASAGGQCAQGIRELRGCSAVEVGPRFAGDVLRGPSASPVGDAHGRWPVERRAVRVERRPVHSLVACSAVPGGVPAAVADAGLMAY